MRSLRQFLIDTEPAMLRVIAARWDIPLESSRPRETAGAIADWLSRPGNAVPIVERLSAHERDALRALIINGGAMGASGFAQRFGSIRPVGPARLERDQPWRAPVSPAEGLWYLGLLYRSFEQRAGGMQDVVIVPAELHPLRALLTAPELPSDTLPPVPPPGVPATAGATFADDLCTLLAHYLNPQDRTWKAQLRNPDGERLELLLRLAQRARLVRSAQRQLDPTPVLAWLGAPTLDQLRGLFTAWSGDEGWSDLHRVPTLKPEPTRSWRDDPVNARQAILEHLRAALPDTWHTLDSLVRRIQLRSPDFARAEFDTWYIRDAATGDYLHGFEAWDKVEGALIRHVVTRPLHWMGLADLGEDRFKVTPLGAVLLGTPSAAPPDPSERAARFAVRADATIDVSASRRLDRFQLTRFADFVSAGDTYVYRLTPSSLARARAKKIDVPRIVESLQKASQAGLPPSVLKAVQRWHARGAEAALEREIILHVNSPAILKTLQSSAKTRNLIGEPLGPTAAKVEEKHWQRLVGALAEMGLLVDVPAGK